MSLHKHHIIPKHAGGTDDPLNITPPISKRMHAMFHYDRWKVLRQPADLAACKLLLGLIACDEARRIASIDGRRRVVASMSIEERRARWGKHRGKKASEDTKQKMREAHAGRTREPMSEESKNKMKATKLAKGWKPSEAHKKSISDAAKGNNHRLGIQWTEEQKQKFRRPNPAVSESNRLRAQARNKIVCDKKS